MASISSLLEVDFRLDDEAVMRDWKKRRESGGDYEGKKDSPAE